MTSDHLIASPSLVPEMPGWSHAADGIDSIIRTVWGMYLTGDISWVGAGQMHDALCQLRDGERPA